MPAKKGKGDGMPLRIGEGPYPEPGEGMGAVGTIAKALGLSWDDAAKKLGDYYGDVQAVLKAAGVRAHGRTELFRLLHRPPPMPFLILPYSVARTCVHRRCRRKMDPASMIGGGDGGEGAEGGLRVTCGLWPHR